jgi:hypothetical protein
MKTQISRCKPHCNKWLPAWLDCDRRGDDKFGTLACVTAAVIYAAIAAAIG